MRIALGQLDSGIDTARNLGAIDDFARRAAAEGARLIAFPEYAAYEKKAVDATFVDIAEPMDGPVCGALAGIAKRHRIAVVAGVVETSAEPAKAHNTLVAFDGAGSLLAFYRKVHLFDAQSFSESTHIAPATDTEPVVFDLEGVRFGLMTCYDLRFPEMARGLSDAGAEVLLVCSSWVPGEHKIDQWRTLLAARAIENGRYVVGACQAAPVSVGHSIVADPMGLCLVEEGSDPSMVSVEISTDLITSVRDNFPTHRQRRLT